MNLLHDVLAVVAGGLVGIASGILGVGGGVFLVPIMTIGFGLKQHVAQGTSLAAIIPTAVVGAVTHGRRGTLNVRMAAWLGAGTTVGALAGALVAIHAPRVWLARAFGVVLIYTAFRMWPRAPQTERSP